MHSVTAASWLGWAAVAVQLQPSSGYRVHGGWVVMLGLCPEEVEELSRFFQALLLLIA